MPGYIDAYGFIFLRVGGSALLFWGVGLMMRMLKVGPNEKIALHDFPRIVACAFFGVALNMLTFFKGLSLTSPISAAVIMVCTPLIVLILSAIIIKEKMRKRKVFGIFLGLFGTSFLILYGKSVGDSSSASWGNFLVLVNAISYGFYLVIVKKLMDKYNAFTFVKWIYLFGFIMVIPFGWSQFQGINWAVLPVDIVWKIGFGLFDRNPGRLKYYLRDTDFLRRGLCVSWQAWHRLDGDWRRLHRPRHAVRWLYRVLA
jgi:drug/metabolite transporter (DMT)-like permease